MKKILVPIDNTAVSKSAVVYAASLAGEMQAEIVLLSVLNAHSSSSTLSGWRAVEAQLISKSERDAAKMMRAVREETGTEVKMSYTHVAGFPLEEVITQFVRDNGIDFVVMGTNGAKGVKKILAGSNSASVIDLSSVPVITVPKGTSPARIRKIVYATDMSHLDAEIKTIADFARPFNAVVEILYVTDDGKRKRSHKQLESILIRIAKYPRVRFNAIASGNIARGVDSFVAKQKVDMLAMFTHRLSFSEKLFGKSITRKLALLGHVPLLAFNRTNL